LTKKELNISQKQVTRLSQIRRGTLGTGIKVHSSGTRWWTLAAIRQCLMQTLSIPAHTLVMVALPHSPQTYAPASADELDIFIGGQRLLLTAEDGSTVNYTVDGSSSLVTLTTVPASGVQVKILQKRGQVWYDQGTSTASNGKGLQKSTTYQARFIAGEPTNAPE
jgi:hypothetical protein